MTELNAPIQEVTVFVDRARITRRGEVRVPAGESVATLRNLPTTLIDDSVRVGGRGAGVRVLGVEATTRYGTEPIEQRAAALRTHLEALEDADRALGDEDTALASRLEYLRELREHGSAELSRGLAFGRATLAQVAELGAYLDQETAVVQARRRDVAGQRRDLARQIEAARRQMQQNQNTNTTPTRELQIAVAADAEVDLQLDVTYAVFGASWEPVYDARLIGDTVALSYKALVRQHTGEDWPGVQLVLSTARPATTTNVPELQPWYLDVPRPRPPMPMSMPAPGGMVPRARMMKEETMAADEMMIMAQPVAPPIVEQQATIEQRGAAVSYRIERPVAVPSDGSPHTTAITTLELPARLDYITAPKLAEEAYLRATVRNASQASLLPGAASVFHEDEFVGRVTLDHVAPQEEFELQLGIDERIKVERELVRRTVEKNLIGNNRRTQVAYRITVTNLLPRQARVTVLDQIPVGRHESIKIRLQEVNPRPSEQTDLNQLTWTLDIGPQQKQEISYLFVVEHPRDLNVIGLE